MSPPAEPQVVNLADFERLAAASLDPAAWAYLAGGAADELTLRDNRQAWDRLRLLPRVLRPLAHGHTRSRLLGQAMPHPILVAPMAYQRLWHVHGEEATALAAAAQGAGLVLSAQASTDMATVAAAVLPQPSRGPLWFQLYWQADRGATLDLVRRAEAAGFEALVLTVDAPCSGVRDRERRAGFRLPEGVHAVNLAPRPPPSGAGLCGGLLQQAPTWPDVQWLRGVTRLPLLLKGVLHPDDAAQAQTLGVDALIVSNHGGRTLDGAVATADALPAIARRLGPAFPLLVDGGIRRGTDVLKALALGAHAVLVGRPVAQALAVGGALAVARCIRLLRDELEVAMALTGCATLADARAAMLWPPAGAAAAPHPPEVNIAIAGSAP